MTYDKIVHYIGKDLCEHIGSLNLEQLTKQKNELITEFNIVKLPADIRFKRTIELTFINQLLKN